MVMSKRKKPESGPGTLYVVATPIGNLEDITYRAARVLSEVDLVAAEDTRKARILFSRYGISTPVTSFYSAAQSRKAPAIVGRLLEGEDVALISEAGTPGISDPGHYLVSMARAEGIGVVPVPGPSALAAAVSASGMNSYAFTFYGFLPPKGGKRKRAIESLAGLGHPFILYESPHRIARTLRDLAEKTGNRKVTICREMTKLHEEFLVTTLAEAAENYGSEKPRGEITLIVDGKPG